MLRTSIVAALLWIPREVWKRKRVRLADHLELAVGRRVTRYHRRYREHLLASLRFIDLKGLATVGFYTPELDDVFVDVSLDYRAPHQVPDSVLADIPEVSDRHSIGDFLDRQQPMVLAVVGAPGSGKTTLLRHTARRVCEGRRGLRRTVPILVYLRDHIGVIVSDPTVRLPVLVRGTLGAHGHREPPGWFEQRLQDGDCVILLDGLDEVARQDDRRAVADWVECQTRQYPKNDFVITSRPQGYRTAPVDGAVVLQVRGFTDDQVTRFVRGWYRAVERHSTGMSTQDVALRAQADADDLLAMLRNAPALSDLTVNPLLLTMVANVHRYRGALPGSRVDLYGEICQVMLWRRHEAKRLTSELSGDRKEGLLRGLAFVMMGRQLRDIPRSQVIDELRPALRRISTTMTCEDFLANVSSNGLLIEREAGYFSFAHLTVQEYLAAMHIRDTGAVDVLAESVSDVWWRETTLLYTARAAADPIVEACLDFPSVTTLALAFDVADSGDLAPELRRRLDSLLESSEGDPARQRLRVGVLITRYLRRSLIRTGTAGRVCGMPINLQIDQMFLAERPEPAPCDRYTGTEPDEPISGVWASDAVAFVRWVNDITGGEPGYWLPTRGELDDPAVRRALTRSPALSHWIHAQSDGPELWTPAGNDHPNRIDGDVLVSHVRDDVTQSIPTLVYLALLHARGLRRAGAALDDIHHTLEFVRELVRDLTRAFARDRIMDRAMDRAMARAIDRGESRDVIRASDLIRTVDDVRNLVRDLARQLEHVHGRAVDRAVGLARSLAFALDLERTIAHVVGLAADTEIGLVDADVVGHALSTALHTAIGLDDETGQRGSGRFARVFIDETGVAGGTYDISLDAVASKIHAAPARLLASTGPALTPWARTVAGRLMETALPIFARQVPIEADTASAIRIAALCLAAEADVNNADDAGDTYRGLAAGITLLERRANGHSPATEAIVLATA